MQKGGTEGGSFGALSMRAKQLLLPSLHLHNPQAQYEEQRALLLLEADARRRAEKRAQREAAEAAAAESEAAAASAAPAFQPVPLHEVEQLVAEMSLPLLQGLAEAQLHAACGGRAAAPGSAAAAAEAPVAAEGQGQEGPSGSEPSAAPLVEDASVDAAAPSALEQPPVSAGRESSLAAPAAKEAATEA